MSLDGKTAVITGASRGIGAAVARLLHERGVNLGLASRSGDDLGLDGVGRAGLRRARRGRAARRSATRPPSASAASTSWSRTRVSAPTVRSSSSREEHLDEMIDVNLKGTLYAVRAALPHMLGREGDIVTLASEAGRRGLPLEAVYCASKFGQVGFTRALDHELREQGIRCTNVCPGGVATDFALDDGRGRTPDVAARDDDRRGRGRGGRVRARAAAPLPHPRDGVAADDGGVVGIAPVRWGIVSTAHINRLVIPGAHESPKVDLVAVASRDLARAEAYAREWEIERAYGSYEELLADPEIEAVYISLPNTLHCEWSIRALEAGKHVLCEKPLSRHPADVEAAFDAADRAGRFLMEAFMYRHNPQTERLQELVAAARSASCGSCARPSATRSTTPENIRLQPDVEGGALMDVGCYCVSGSRLLAGEPESVFGQALIGASGTDWVFAGTLRFPGDVLAQFDCGTALPERDELEAIGSEGSLFLDDPWHCRKPVIELRRDDDVERIELEPVDSYRLELENLSDAIRGEAEPLLGRDDALAQARALEALHRSAETGQLVELAR